MDTYFNKDIDSFGIGAIVRNNMGCIRSSCTWLILTQCLKRKSYVTISNVLLFSDSINDVHELHTIDCLLEDMT